MSRRVVNIPFFKFKISECHFFEESLVKSLKTYYCTFGSLLTSKNVFQIYFNKVFFLLGEIFEGRASHTTRASKEGETSSFSARNAPHRTFI